MSSNDATAEMVDWLMRFIKLWVAKRCSVTSGQDKYWPFERSWPTARQKEK